MKRIFLIVLDSCGAGAMPDSERFGDVGVNTLRSWRRVPGAAYSQSAEGRTGKHPGLSFLGREPSPTGRGPAGGGLYGEATPPLATGRLRGGIAEAPAHLSPGLSPEVLEAFEAATGRGVLCNRPYSGTDVIRDYGAEQLKTGKWIVYTSADSVFQIAAHEECIPLE